MATPFLCLGLEGSKANRLEVFLAFSSFSLLAPIPFECFKFKSPKGKTSANPPPYFFFFWFSIILKRYFSKFSAGDGAGDITSIPYGSIR